MSKQPKGRDYSQLLIWSAAAVTVVRYAAAFIASDVGEITGWLSEVITFLMGFSGLGMGILDVIGGTYLFDGWRRTMPAAGKSWPFRFRVLTAFVFLLIVTGVGILVPFTVSRVRHVGMDIVLAGDWLTWWALLVNVAPYLLIGGVAVGNQVVNVGTTNEQTNGSANGSLAVVRESRTFASLTNSEKYYIVNNPSKIAAGEFGVSDRAVQKWRLKIQEQIGRGEL